MLKYLQILILVMFFGCNTKNQETALASENESFSDCAKIKSIKLNQSNSICLVVCDLSGSLESTINKMKLDAQKIFKNMSVSNKIQIYAVSDNSFCAPIIVSKTYSSKSGNGASVLKDIADVNAYNRDLGANIFDTLNYYQKLPEYRSSCIFITMQNVCREAANLVKSGYLNIQILVLSDMQEVCSSELGVVDFEKTKSFNAYKTLEKLENKPKLPCTVKCSVVVSSDDTKDATALVNFWSKIIEKLGIAEEPYFSPSLPSWIQ